MSIQRVVVATDFSDHAGLAVKHAMAVARHAGASLVVVHACAATEAQLAWARHGAASSPTLRHLVRQASAHAHDQLEHLYEQLGGQGVEVSQLLVDAPVADAICDAADQLQADLVVVGAGAERPFFGGVAEKVVRGCAGDVLVARGGAPAGGFRRILAAVDFHPRGERAIEVASQLAARGARMEIVHSWFAPLAFAGAFGQGAVHTAPFTDELVKSAQSACETLAVRHADSRIELTARTLLGPPRSAILEHARDGGFDLIAVGSHGRHGVGRFFLGSVAESIVRHADRAVLVTHGAPVVEGEQP